ncbi:hypothetical protein NEOKW01_0302 [Nematocida sp. AWRm80]|nr:hypothetical protein NEOKW01_0302 [Nematocida sp. AWRm80]
MKQMFYNGQSSGTKETPTDSACKCKKNIPKDQCSMKDIPDTIDTSDTTSQMDNKNILLDQLELTKISSAASSSKQEDKEYLTEGISQSAKESKEKLTHKEIAYELSKVRNLFKILKSKRANRRVNSQDKGIRKDKQTRATRKTEIRKPTETLIDHCVLSIAILSISLDLSDSTVGYSWLMRVSHLFCSVLVSAVLIWPFSELFMPNELMVLWAVLCKVLQCTEKPKEICWTLLVRNTKGPLFMCLRSMAAYGISTVLSQLGSIQGIFWWLFGMVVFFVLLALEFFLCLYSYSINSRRKLVHLFVFLYFICVPVKYIRVQLIGLLFIFLFFSRIFSSTIITTRSVSEKRVFSVFTSQKDSKGVVSHILMAFCSLCLVECLSNDYERMIFALSSVCILDTVASIAPRDKSSHKSIIGCVLGIVSNITVLSFLGIYYPPWMHVLLGLTEYTTRMNDNLVLPFMAYVITGI